MFMMVDWSAVRMPAVNTAAIPASNIMLHYLMLMSSITESATERLTVHSAQCCWCFVVEQQSYS
jgi:hypothetical protein